MSSPIILLISDRTPSIEQMSAAETIGYEIKSIGKVSPLVSQNDFHKFIHFKRMENIHSEDFGVNQRDIVISTDVPALALMANNDGYTVALFDEDNSIRLFDPQFGAPFVSIPYVPPVIPDRQELTDEEREEMRAAQSRQTAMVGADEDEE